MKINDKMKTHVNFGDINPGQCFKFADSYYMKTECTSDEGEMYNAVDLSDGSFDYFDDYGEPITLLNCELVVG